MSDRFTIGLIVSNHHGVLNRIAGLYSKRCYNIDSLAVGETEDPRFSRMTIVSTGDEYTRTQVVKQLNKLHDVKLAVCSGGESVYRGASLIKTPQKRRGKPRSPPDQRLRRRSRLASTSSKRI
jgi:acetolactate synthase-1/3 small subunit